MPAQPRIFVQCRAHGAVSGCREVHSSAQGREQSGVRLASNSQRRGDQAPSKPRFQFARFWTSKYRHRQRLCRKLDLETRSLISNSMVAKVPGNPGEGRPKCDGFTITGFPCVLVMALRSGAAPAGPRSTVHGEKGCSGCNAALSKCSGGDDNRWHASSSPPTSIVDDREQHQQQEQQREQR